MFFEKFIKCIRKNFDDQVEKGVRWMPGLKGRENAGMSNDKESENLSRRKPKVSWGR